MEAELRLSRLGDSEISVGDKRPQLSSLKKKEPSLSGRLLIKTSIELLSLSV